MADRPPARHVAVKAADVAPRDTPSNYPEPFAARVAGRKKRQLGDVFGLSNFGVNLTRRAPDAVSALHHVHAWQDGFIHVLEGRPSLVSGDVEQVLEPVMCAGFAAGGAAHHLENRTDADAVILEVGDRSPGNSIGYPADDLRAERTASGWRFTHKDGTRC